MGELITTCKAKEPPFHKIRFLYRNVCLRTVETMNNIFDENKVLTIKNINIICAIRLMKYSNYLFSLINTKFTDRIIDPVHLRVISFYN